jgi:hypothetical protein
MLVVVLGMRIVTADGPSRLIPRAIVAPTPALLAWSAQYRRAR